MMTPMNRQGGQPNKKQPKCDVIRSEFLRSVPFLIVATGGHQQLHSAKTDDRQR